MNLKFLRFTLMLFGLLLASLTIAIITTRNDDELLHAMVINSNIRDYDQALYLMSPDGVILRRLTDIPGNEYVLDQSPDGKWLIIKSVVNSNTYSVNISSGAIREIADSISYLLAISPDSRWAYFQRSEYSTSGNYALVIFRVPLNGGHQQQIVTTGNNLQYFNYIGLSPDGEWLYVSNEHLIRINTRTRATQTLRNDDLGAFSQMMGWSSDGAWIVTLYQRRTFDRLYRMRPDGQDRQELLPITIGRIYQVVFSPQNDRLFILVNNNGINRLYSIFLDGSNLQLIGQDIATFVGWSTDPDWGLFIDTSTTGNNNLIRLNILTGDRHIVLSNATTSFWWSPDRQHIAYFRNSSSPAPHYYLTDINKRTRRDILFEDGTRFESWSPDSQWLYFDKSSSTASQLFRINISNGQRQTIHTPALHNNYQPIFSAWIPINAATWRASYNIVLSLFFLLIFPTISHSRKLIRGRRRMD